MTRLWSYFSDAPLPAAHARALQRIYVSSGRRIRPVVEGMLMHPLLHAGPRMVKPPIVQIAGMLRGVGRFIDTDAWVWESSLAGQTPFYPPNVAGLGSGPLAEHRHLAGALQPRRPGHRRPPQDPRRGTSSPPIRAPLTAKALAFWGSPTVGRATRAALVSYAKAAAVDAANERWEREQYPALTLGALRALVVASPDYQTS